MVLLPNGRLGLLKSSSGKSRDRCNFPDTAFAAAGISVYVLDDTKQIEGYWMRYNS